MSVVDYSISVLKRIDKELKLAEDISLLKNVSIIGMKLDLLDDSILNALSQSLRTSDALFLYDGIMVMVLFGTSKEGAISLANQLKEFFGEDTVYTVMTYPEDGTDTQELINNFRIMLKLKLNVDFYRL